jgi:hypothetical protein
MCFNLFALAQRAFDIPSLGVVLTTSDRQQISDLRVLNIFTSIIPQPPQV